MFICEWCLYAMQTFKGVDRVLFISSDDLAKRDAQHRNAVEAFVKVLLNSRRLVWCCCVGLVVCCRLLVLANIGSGRSKTCCIHLMHHARGSNSTRTCKESLFHCMYNSLYAHQLIDCGRRSS